MTSKEKAQELVDKYHKCCNCTIAGASSIFKSIAKQCALIAVDEILTYHDSLFECGLKNVHQTFETPTEIYNDVMNPQKKYWQQVRKEIKSLKTKNKKDGKETRTKFSSNNSRFIIS